MSETIDTAALRAEALTNTPGLTLRALCDEVDRLRTEVDRLRTERDEARAALDRVRALLHDWENRATQEPTVGRTYAPVSLRAELLRAINGPTSQ